MYATSIEGRPLQPQQLQPHAYPNSCKNLVIPIYVNGRGTLALMDTGCEWSTLVHPDFIEESDYTGEHLLVRCWVGFKSNDL